MNRLAKLIILLALLLAACAPAAAPPTDGGILTVMFLDIGQGDATLIRSPNGMTMLIDGGNSDKDAREVILPQLREWGVDQLDVMVLTHPDADHVGGLPLVIESFAVDTVALTGQLHTTQVYERFLTDVRDFDLNAIAVRTGTQIPFDDAVRIEVVAPDDRFVEDDDKNNASIVIRLTYGQVSFLLTSDAEAKLEEAILDSGVALSSTFLKVGHHGSNTSSTEAWLDAVNAQIGVISVGEGNRYDHPRQEVLDRLAQYGIEIYRTDLQGTITVTTDGSNIDIVTER